MARLKTFLIYALIIIGFFLFSNFIIDVGLNSSYRDITRKDNTSQVQISEAQATLVNGKIKGTINDSGNDNLTGKYVEIDLYSSRDNMVGKRYIDIETTDANPTQDFSMYFEAEDVTSYSISITDEKTGEELKILPEEWNKSQIVIVTVLTMLMLW